MSIDFRTLPTNLPSLCIPRVFANITEQRIRSIFAELTLGELERIDIVSKTTEKGDRYNRVYIHFRRWSNTENANIARERLLNGKEIKIIYDEPWFWKISAYRERPGQELKPERPHNRVQRAPPTIQFDDAEQVQSRPRPQSQNSVPGHYGPRQEQRNQPREDRRTDVNRNRGPRRNDTPRAPVELNSNYKPNPINLLKRKQPPPKKAVEKSVLHIEDDVEEGEVKEEKA